MNTRDIVVIGASAGGIEAMTELLSQLPAAFPAAIFFVMHMNPETPSTLPPILQRHCHMPVKAAQDSEPISAGNVYVAVPDRHLTLEKDRVCVSHGPKINRNRPSIDSLFFSAANAYGARVIGVVLTGLLDDGAQGLAAIKRAGGVAMVQSPEDALFSSMPKNAIQADDPDFVLPLEKIPAKLLELVKTPLTAEAAAAGDDAGTRQDPMPSARNRPQGRGNGRGNGQERKQTMAGEEKNVEQHEHKPGDPSVYVCPECGGTLWEIRNGTTARYECRIGHSYSQLNLAEAHRENLETALWTALRTLEESASLSKRMAENARKRNLMMVAGRWDEASRTRARDAEVIRELLYRDTDVAVNE